MTKRKTKKKPKPKIPVRNCTFCSHPYQPTREWQKYCPGGCKEAARKEGPISREILRGIEAWAEALGLAARSLAEVADGYAEKLKNIKQKKETQ